MRLRRRSSVSGQIIGVLIILLVIVGGGYWFLNGNKARAEADARAFAAEAMQRLAVQYDSAFFAAHLGRDARIEFPPSRQANYLAKFRELGVPMQPIPIEGDVRFKSGFFEPSGFFKGTLNYPSQPGSIEIAISRPSGRWQIDNIDIKWQAWNQR